MGMYGDDFITPITNQDLASVSMQPMPLVGFGMPLGMYNTNLLGGVKMHTSPDKDIYRNMQEKEAKDMSLLKKVGIAILVMGGIAMIKFAPIAKWVSSKYSKAADWFKNLFKKKPPTPPTPPTPPPAVSTPSTAVTP